MSTSSVRVQDGLQIPVTDSTVPQENQIRKKSTSFVSKYDRDDAKHAFSVVGRADCGAHAMSLLSPPALPPATKVKKGNAEHKSAAAPARLNVYEETGVENSGAGGNGAHGIPLGGTKERSTSRSGSNGKKVKLSRSSSRQPLRSLSNSADASANASADPLARTGSDSTLVVAAQGTVDATAATTSLEDPLCAPPPPSSPFRHDNGVEVPSAGQGGGGKVGGASSVKGSSLDNAGGWEYKECDERDETDENCSGNGPRSCRRSGSRNTSGGGGVSSGGGTEKDDDDKKVSKQFGLLFSSSSSPTISLRMTNKTKKTKKATAKKTSTNKIMTAMAKLSMSSPSSPKGCPPPPLSMQSPLIQELVVTSASSSPFHLSSHEGGDDDDDYDDSARVDFKKTATTSAGAKMSDTPVANDNARSKIISAGRKSGEFFYDNDISGYHQYDNGDSNGRLHHRGNFEEAAAAAAAAVGTAEEKEAKEEKGRVVMNLSKMLDEEAAAASSASKHHHRLSRGAGRVGRAGSVQRQVSKSPPSSVSVASSSSSSSSALALKRRPAPSVPSLLRRSRSLSRDREEGRTTLSESSGEEREGGTASSGGGRSRSSSVSSSKSSSASRSASKSSSRSNKGNPRASIRKGGVGANGTAGGSRPRRSRSLNSAVTQRSSSSSLPRSGPQRRIVALPPPKQRPPGGGGGIPLPPQRPPPVSPPPSLSVPPAAAFFASPSAPTVLSTDTVQTTAAAAEASNGDYSFLFPSSPPSPPTNRLLFSPPSPPSTTPVVNQTNNVNSPKVLENGARSSLFAKALLRAQSSSTPRPPPLRYVSAHGDDADEDEDEEEEEEEEGEETKEENAGNRDGVDDKEENFGKMNYPKEQNEGGGNGGGDDECADAVGSDSEEDGGADNYGCVDEEANWKDGGISSQDGLFDQDTLCLLKSLDVQSRSELRATFTVGMLTASGFNLVQARKLLALGDVDVDSEPPPPTTRGGGGSSSGGGGGSGGGRARETVRSRSSSRGRGSDPRQQQRMPSSSSIRDILNSGVVDVGCNVPPEKERSNKSCTLPAPPPPQPSQSSKKEEKKKRASTSSLRTAKGGDRLDNVKVFDRNSTLKTVSDRFTSHLRSPRSLKKESEAYAKRASAAGGGEGGGGSASVGRSLFTVPKAFRFSTLSRSSSRVLEENRPEQPQQLQHQQKIERYQQKIRDPKGLTHQHGEYEKRMAANQQQHLQQRKLQLQLQQEESLRDGSISPGEDLTLNAGKGWEGPGSCRDNDKSSSSSSSSNSKTKTNFTLTSEFKLTNGGFKEGAELSQMAPGSSQMGDDATPSEPRMRESTSLTLSAARKEYEARVAKNESKNQNKSTVAVAFAAARHTEVSMANTEDGNGCGGGGGGEVGGRMFGPNWRSRTAQEATLERAKFEGRKHKGLVRTVPVAPSFEKALSSHRANNNRRRSTHHTSVKNTDIDDDDDDGTDGAGDDGNGDGVSLDSSSSSSSSALSSSEGVEVGATSSLGTFAWRRENSRHLNEQKEAYHLRTATAAITTVPLSPSFGATSKYHSSNAEVAKEKEGKFGIGGGYLRSSESLNRERTTFEARMAQLEVEDEEGHRIKDSRVTSGSSPSKRNHKSNTTVPVSFHLSSASSEQTEKLVRERRQATRDAFSAEVRDGGGGSNSSASSHHSQWRAGGNGGVGGGGTLLGGTERERKERRARRERSYVSTMLTAAKSAYEKRVPSLDESSSNRNPRNRQEPTSPSVTTADTLEHPLSTSSSVSTLTAASSSSPASTPSSAITPLSTAATTSSSSASSSSHRQLQRVTVAQGFNLSRNSSKQKSAGEAAAATKSHGGGGGETGSSSSSSSSQEERDASTVAGMLKAEKCRREDASRENTRQAEAYRVRMASAAASRRSS